MNNKMALLTLTYQYTEEKDGISISCLNTDEIYTHCYAKEDIEKNAIEVSELILEDYVGREVPLKDSAQHIYPGKNQFQLVFDMTTGKHLELVYA